MSLRQTLLGTRMGRWARSRRLRASIARAAKRDPEIVGQLANDYLSEFLICRLAEPGEVFIDVGAHFGLITGEVLRHCGQSPVIAIEATPSKARQLQRRYPTVAVHSCALGDEDLDEVAFFVDTRRPACSGLQLEQESQPEHVVEIRTPLRRLDSLLSQENAQIVKIDVEGAELQVLRGATSLISEKRPLVMFESGLAGNEEATDRSREIWRWLMDRSYEILVPNRLAHDGPGLDCQGFLESHAYPRRTTNYFAVPKDRRALFRDRARDRLEISPQALP